MSKLEKPGYPLPAGELGEDEIVCQLVYLPNRDEYWQALLAAIHYMSTWHAWERDVDKRGKDAAANWRAAFELTIGCWRMTCLEELTQNVAGILELLQNRKDCCDDNITYLPGPEIDTDIVPFDGDPPAEYGETEIADWDEWASHVCYNANLYVDYLAHVGDELWDASKTSVIFIGLVAALLSLLAFSGIGLPIAFGVAAAITSGIVLTGTITTFDGTEEAIEAARNNIVCSILQGIGLREAVEDALESGLDWDLFFQFIDYDSAIAILWEGGANGEFLPADTTECGCNYFLFLIEGDSLIGYRPVTVRSETLEQGGFFFESANMKFQDFDTRELRNVSLTALDFDITPINRRTGSTYVMYDEDALLVYNSDTPPGLPFTMAVIRVVDQYDTEPEPPPNKFEMTLTWSEI